MVKIRQLVKNILYVSKVTKVTSKKLRILTSVLLANITVYTDILIILLFTYLLTGNELNISILEFFVNNLYLLPLVVLLRYFLTMLEKANIFSLKEEVEKNLRVYLLTEVYKSGNYSIADSTYYTNTFANHLGWFYLGLTNFINALVQVFVYSSFLIYSDFQTLTAFSIGAVVLFFPTRYLLKLGRKFMQKDWDTGQQSNRGIERVIQNMFLIKILDTSKFEIERFEKVNTNLQDAKFKHNLFGAINTLFPNFLVLFLLATLMIFSETLKTVSLEFLGVTLRLVQSIGTLNNSLNKIVSSQVHLDEFVNLETNKQTIPPNYFFIDKNQNEAVRIKELNFKYFNSEEMIFENLNLMIPKNSHTVITGPNGSGKSTLLGLIAKIYYPISGNVSLFSEKLGYVGASPLILSDTLRNNILYGHKEKVDDKVIVNLLNELNFENPNEKLLNSIVDNKSLSLGQMQKISFIRALLGETKLLILDESTSNLDKETKDQIFKTLSKRNMTIINSTHNFEDFEFDNHLKIKIENNKRILKLY
jgi:ABC-type multidrug transport system fused ATPase/permease subunit